MTVRVLVDHEGAPADSLAIALRCIMDVYLRMPRDIVLVLPDSPAGDGALAALVGKDAASLVRQAPQPFADHTMQVVAPAELSDENLKGRLVVAQDATAGLVERIERHVIDGLIVVPRPGTDLDEWAVRVHAEVVRAGPGDAPPA